MPDVSYKSHLLCLTAMIHPIGRRVSPTDLIFPTHGDWQRHPCVTVSIIPRTIPAYSPRQLRVSFLVSMVCGTRWVWSELAVACSVCVRESVCVCVCACIQWWDVRSIFTSLHYLSSLFWNLLVTKYIFGELLLLVTKYYFVYFLTFLLLNFTLL